MMSFLQQLATTSGVRKKTDRDSDHDSANKRKKFSDRFLLRCQSDAPGLVEHLTDPMFWGPYLSERQWGTVREDYSADGSCWSYLDHKLSRKQAYHWGEDGLLGISDKFGLLCASLALWNYKDPILKERLFGLTGDEGNHGEDVKELYYYLDNTPKHTYMQALYKYPQSEFPYEDLVNHGRTSKEPELEITDLGLFDDSLYWDVQVEYAKAATSSIVCKITVTNNANSSARLDVIPQFFFRNTWSWPESDSSSPIPSFHATGDSTVDAVYDMGIFRIAFHHEDKVKLNSLLFTNNESVYSAEDQTSCGDVSGPSPLGRKDAFHKFIIDGDKSAVRQDQTGSKFCAWMTLTLEGHASTSVYWQIFPADCMVDDMRGKLDLLIKREKAKAMEFYKKISPMGIMEEEANICRQAIAGLLWSKQFYSYKIETKLKELKKIHGDHFTCKNQSWIHLNCHDILLMPDKWEFPWFAAWDLAFHCVQMARVDIDFAKDQILLLLSDRYMHTNGQIPGCEFDLSDPNPPILCWAVWSIYNRDEKKDHSFLKTCFIRLIFSFQWWAKMDPNSTFLYGNGFMGLDNISLFDRSVLPSGTTQLKQADCTGWMGQFALTMLQIALELSPQDSSYNDMAVKFLKHFLHIARAINKPVSSGGLWSDEDKFFYDVLHYGPHENTAVRLRSWSGIIPLLACGTIHLKHCPVVKSFLLKCDRGYSPYVCKLGEGSYFLTLVSYNKLKCALKVIFSENEFLSPYGIRSLSKVYQATPYSFDVNQETRTTSYLPGESSSDLFGGNSNWRGPIWLCMNYLFVECLEKYSDLNSVFTLPLTMNYPSGTSYKKSFLCISQDISRRVVSLFMPNIAGIRPVHGPYAKYYKDPMWKGLLLFYEYYHADTGRGCGASHQTGWSALVLEFLHKIYQQHPQRA